MWKRFKNLRKNKAKPPTIKTCSRRNQNLFAKKPKKVREQFRKSSRTICKKFANIFQLLREHRFKPLRTTRKTDIKQLLSRGSQMLTSTKCTFVPHNMYFCAPRVLLPCPTGPTLVPHDRYFIILCKLCACVSCCFSDSFGSLKNYIRLEENL